MNSRRPVNSTVRALRFLKNHKRNARLVARARRAANVDVQIPDQDERGSRRPRFPFLATEVTCVARYNGGRSNKSLDRSGGCAFCIIIGPAKVEW